MERSVLSKLKGECMIGHTQALWAIIIMTAANLILAVANTIEIEKLKHSKEDNDE